MAGRWRTLEYYCYYGYTIIFFLQIIVKSRRITSAYETEQWRPWMPGLRKGWIPGSSHMDLTDAQWRNFRESLYLLAGVMAALSIASVVARGVAKRGNSLFLPRFWLFASLSYAAHLHGACTIFIIFFGSVNYLLVKFFAGRKFFPALLWSFNFSVLILNRIYDGYSFSSLGPNFVFLDHHRGVFRWQICYNLVMLRMVSYGLDSHWDRCQSTIRAGIDCWETYFSYLLFPPLYIAGPIITYGSFSSQLLNSAPIPFRQVALYGLRWLLSFLLMEVLSHYFHFSAMAASGLWQQLPAADICVLGYGVLNIMWLKFLLIWRFFRFWSMMCGVEPPENMLRCVNNSYSIEGFWKGWHSSYNKWLVRYMYIPLGGASWRAFNMWIIFGFVAMWHDLDWRLLSWAWLTCLLALPEILAKYLMRSSYLDAWRSHRVYEDICAVGGAVSIAGLMVANLVGFVIGTSGLTLFLEKILSRENALLIFVIFFSFYVGTKVMFEIQGMKSRGQSTGKRAE